LPVGETDTFTTDDDRVYAWTAWEGAAGSHTIRWESYRPDGTLYGTSLDDFDYSPYSLAYLWYWLSIPYMGNDFGEWSVRFYMDGSYKGSLYFTLAAGAQSQIGDQSEPFTSDAIGASGAWSPMLQPASGPVKAEGD